MTNHTNGNMLRAALAMAATGVHVFPCAPDKSPLTKTGFYDATTDAHTITAWWTEFPSALIGLPTGQATGLFVLDVDIAEGLDGNASLSDLFAGNGEFELPTTRIVRTPRGGKHIYFKHPGKPVKNSTGKLGPGLDVRGDGGYIIAPPSHIERGAYVIESDAPIADAPDWFVALVVKPDPPRLPTPPPTDSAPPKGYGDAAIRGECNRVSTATQGTRNATLNTAAFNLGTLVNTGAIQRQSAESALIAAAANCGLIAEDGQAAIEKTIRSGLDAGSKTPRSIPERPRKTHKSKTIATMARGNDPSDGMYFNSNAKSFLSPDDQGGWINMSETQIKRILRIRNVDTAVPKGETVSEMDLVIAKIQMSKNVAYAGALAGHSAGLIEMGGRRILVTESPVFIEPAPGDWPVLRSIITGMLGDDQAQYLYGWLKVAYEALRAGKNIPGQAFCMAGKRDCGKSLIQKLFTPIFGGRCSRPFQYMIGSSQFNAHMFSAEHLMVEDEVPSTDLRSRRIFGAQLKSVTVNEDQQCHAKGQTPIMLHPFWRLSVTLNDEPENLMVLPPIDESLIDKITLLKAEQRAMPMPTATTDDRERFWATLLSELPAFIHHLVSWKIPATMVSQRFGVAHFQHPALLDALSALSPENKLMSLVQAYLFDDLNKEWHGTAEDLERKLTGSQSECRFEATRLFAFNTACSVYLARLAHRFPLRFCRSDDRSHAVWSIYQTTMEPAPF